MGLRRSSGRTSLVLVALAVTVTLVGAGCGSSGDPSGASSSDASLRPNAQGAALSGPTDADSIDGGNLIYGMEAEPEGLDPTRYAFSQSGNLVASAVFDPLATLDANGKPVPYLATAIEPNADYTVWTIGIPKGVTFHDGTPLTAQVVADGLEAYHKSLIIGPSMNGWFQSATAPDPEHVIVTTAFPFRILPGALATQIGYVFAPSMLTDTSLAKKPVGTGPFVFQHHEDGKIWSFKKNPNYRRPGLPHLDAIDFVPIVDEPERIAKLKNGDIDLLQSVGSADTKELSSSDLKVVESRNGDKAFLMLNTSKPPFDNLLARQAVARATDSAGWRKEVYGDVASPANSPFGPSQPGFVQDNGFPTFDPAKAKELVAQYKAQTGKDLEFTFLAAADVTNASYAQYMVPAFEAAGMKVTVEQKPQINLLAQVATGDYQMSQFRLFANPDPRVDSIFYRTDSIGPISLDFPRFSNPAVDEVTKKAIAESDEKSIDQDLQRVSRIMADQVPFVWLGQTIWYLAANEKVNGISAAANGTVPTLTPHTWLATLSRAK